MISFPRNLAPLARPFALAASHLLGIGFALGLPHCASQRAANEARVNTSIIQNHLDFSVQISKAGWFGNRMIVFSKRIDMPCLLRIAYPFEALPSIEMFGNETMHLIILTGCVACCL